MTSAQHHVRIRPATTLLLILTPSIFLVALGIELAYPYLLRFLPAEFVVVADPSILTILLFPLLLIFVLRPMTREMAAREKAQEELAVFARDLEKRVEEQTATLESEIAEREQSAESLRLFRALMDQLSDGIEVIDPATGAILDVNETSCKVLGYTREELLSLRVFDFDPIIDELSFAAVVESLCDTKTNTIESVHQRKDGTRFPVEVTLRCVSFGRDYMVSVVRDITDRIHAEEERKRLAMAIEHAAEVVMITDVDGTITYVNPAFEQVTGYTRTEVLGKNPRILKSGKQDDAFYSNLWKTISAGDVWHGNVTNRRKDGKLYEEEATISPVRDKRGEVIAFVAIKRDITKQLSLESQLRQAQKMEAIGGLAAGIAHDFNNILAAILGYTQLAITRVDEQTDILEHLERVEKASIRARDLVQQILTFSRQTESAFRPTRLDIVIEEALKLLRASLPPEIEFHVNIEDWDGTVQADPTQIHQIIMNLCTNAAHAMREHGGVLDVSLGTVEIDVGWPNAVLDLDAGLWARLSVSDTGHGMDAATLERIFEPFFTTKQDDAGTGLGLSTVHGIVKQHGGKITAYSELGLGSVFHVYLPLSREATDQIGERLSDPPRGHGEHVLVVDDEEPLAAMAAEMLEGLGYSVTVMTDALEALKVFQTDPERFDLVLTDHAMPKMGGDKLVAEMRRIRPDVTVLVTTGYSAKIDEKVLGIAGVLLKPVLYDTLAIAVQSALHPST